MTAKELFDLLFVGSGKPKDAVYPYMKVPEGIIDFRRQIGPYEVLDGQTNRSGSHLFVVVMDDHRIAVCRHYSTGYRWLRGKPDQRLLTKLRLYL